MFPFYNRKCFDNDARGESCLQGLTHDETQETGARDSSIAQIGFYERLALKKYKCRSRQKLHNCGGKKIL